MTRLQFALLAEVLLNQSIDDPGFGDRASALLRHLHQTVPPLEFAHCRATATGTELLCPTIFIVAFKKANIGALEMHAGALV